MLVVHFLASLLTYGDGTDVNRQEKWWKGKNEWEQVGVQCT